MRQSERHAFQAIQLSERGTESILDTFTVTKTRNADTAYGKAEALCQLARDLPHKPPAFVREVNAPNVAADDWIDDFNYVGSRHHY